MKGLLVILLTVLAAGTALAYGRAELAMASGGWSPTEPATLLLSGSALLGLGAALRRYEF